MFELYFAYILDVNIVLINGKVIEARRSRRGCSPMGQRPLQLLLASIVRVVPAGGDDAPAPGAGPPGQY